MKLYKNYFVLGAFGFLFFAFAGVDLMIAVKRTGTDPVDSWSIMSGVGKFCAVMVPVIIIYVFVTLFVKDKRK